MPIEVGIWRIDGSLRKLESVQLSQEKRVEEILTSDISLIDPNLLLIGRQVPTDHGKFIDLLGIDPSGNVVIIELKRDRTPREAVAQLLDYGSWVRDIRKDRIEDIYSKFASRSGPEQKGVTLDQAFRAKFEIDEVPDEFNENHRLVLVATELDDSSERIINYLAEEYGLDINAVFFRVFRDGNSEYLTRAWLVDPEEVEVKVSRRRDKVDWNGEFYVSFSKDRPWNEAVEYGFISAGGSPWYSGTLRKLEPGNRIWVNVPQVGYVGVGRVTEAAVPADQFFVQNGSSSVSIDKLDFAKNFGIFAKDGEDAEYVARVDWLKTKGRDQAVKEKGFFGSQHSVAKPRDPKWTHTVKRLKERFGITD